MLSITCALFCQIDENTYVRWSLLPLNANSAESSLRSRELRLARDSHRWPDARLLPRSDRGGVSVGGKDLPRWSGAASEDARSQFIPAYSTLLTACQ